MEVSIGNVFILTYYLHYVTLITVMFRHYYKRLALLGF